MAKENYAVDPALVRELAAILREADLGEIEVEQGDLKIRVSKPVVHAAPAAQYHYAPQAPAAAPSAPAAVAASATPAAESGKADGWYAHVASTVHLP